MRSMSEAISLGLVSLLSIELFAPVRVPVVQKVPIVQTPSCILILGLLRIIIDEVILCKPDFKSLLAEDLPSPIPSRIASRLSRPAKERSQRFNRKSSLGGPI